MPLDAGPRVIAYLRGHGVLVVAPLAEGDAGADLLVPEAAEGRWRDVVTGAERTLAGVVPVSELVDGFPVALLERVSGEGGGHTSGMESGWTPEGWEDGGPATPDRLPRVEDLPAVEGGYEREAVQRAFDSFYRHAAELDATLRVLESMELFARQAGDLRADLRALRAASWGPVPAVRPAWRPQREERVLAGPVGGAAPRLALEAAFIILVAVGAALADLPRPVIVALVLASWLLVGISEFAASTRRASLRPALLPPPPARTASAVPADEAPQRVADMLGEPTMIEAPPSFDDPEPAPVEPEPVVEAAPEPVAEAEPVEEPEPEVAVQPQPDEEPEPEVVARSDDAVEPPAIAATRRRWFRGRRAEQAPEPLAAEPSRHVRVVPAPPLDEPAAEIVELDAVAPEALPVEPEQMAIAEPDGAPWTRNGMRARCRPTERNPRSRRRRRVANRS